MEGSEDMKKRICIYAFFVVFLVVIIGITLLYLKQEKYTEVSSPDIFFEINSIPISQLDSLLDNKRDDTLLYFGRPNCVDCNEFDPTLFKWIKKYNVESKIIYINVEKIRKSDTEWKDFKNKYGIEYTPTLAIFRGTEQLKKIQWTPQNGTDLNEFEKFIKYNGDSIGELYK